jgi:hypothetical protein
MHITIDLTTPALVGLLAVCATLGMLAYTSLRKASKH